MLDKILQIKEIIELIYHFRKAILLILLIGIVVIIFLFNWISKFESEDELKRLNEWNSIQPGDSIFIKDNVLYLDFYKKGREKLSDYEQREIKYHREDTLNFIKQNTIPEKYFYKNGISFIGICTGKDSAITKEGEYNSHRWIRIKPSYKISHPPKSDKYDFEARKWENNTESYFVNGKLSKDYYVKFDEITCKNNDSIFRE